MSVYLGVMTKGGLSDLSQIAGFQQEVGKRPAVLNGGISGFTVDTGQIAAASWRFPESVIIASCMPPVSLGSIANGSADAAIAGMAKGLAALDSDLVLRFAHEMNGNWYSWGQKPAAYVAAWRHMAGIVRANAPRVRLFWCCNMAFSWSSGLYLPDQYFPGDDFVDFVGFDAYNKPIGSGGWKELSALIMWIHDDLAALSSKPQIIGELGCAEVADFLKAGKTVPAGASKSSWIETGFWLLKGFDRIAAFSWFDVNQLAPGGDGSGNFAADSSAPVLAAFQKSMQDADYLDSTI